MNVNRSIAANSDDIWVYHERQQAALCGQHALNNLVQSPVFTAHQLSTIAHQLDELELAKFRDSDDPMDYHRRLAEGSGNVDAAGNFSIQVLKVALQNENQIELPCLTDEEIHSKQKDITTYDGFLCHKSDHWFAIRQVGGRFWNLNSTLEVPEVVGHFALATNMQKWRGEGYTVFIAHGLPAAGHKQKVMAPNAHCHNMSDLIKGQATPQDHWETMQSGGRRLDGGSNIHDTAYIHQLSEDEQLAMALSASVADPPAPARPMVEVPPEPAAGNSGAVRMQLKLPDGRKCVRRFLSTDSVAVIEAFAAGESQNRPVQVLVGFPPRPLEHSVTIDEAGLANQSVQIRFK